MYQMPTRILWAKVFEKAHEKSSWIIYILIHSIDRQDQNDKYEWNDRHMWVKMTFEIKDHVFCAVFFV